MELGKIAKFAGKMIGDGTSSPLTSLLGAGQLVSGFAKRRQADAALPGAEDLGQRQELNYLRRRRRAVETGTAGATQSAAARQMAKSAGVNAFKAGGPMNFGVLNQLISGSAAAQAEALGQERQGLTAQIGGLVDTMAQRRFDRQMYMEQVKRAQAEQAISGGGDNLLAGIGVSPNKKKKKKVSGATDGSSDMA